MSTYCVLSRMTVALPLSAGRMTRSVLVLREVRAVPSSLDRLGFGGRAECRILAVSKQIESAVFLDRILMEVATALINSFLSWNFLRRGGKIKAFRQKCSLIWKGSKMTN